MATLFQRLFTPRRSETDRELSRLQKENTGLKKAAKDAVEVARDSVKKSKTFTTTSGGQQFQAHEVTSGKSWKSLLTLAEELPGVPQAILKIQDAALAGGWMLTSPEADAANPPEVEHLLEQPNPDDTWDDILRGTIYNLETFGNAYWEIVKTESGDAVGQVYLLPSQNVRILIDEEDAKRGVEKIVGFSRTVTVGGIGKEIIYDQSEILHFKLDSPDGSIYGTAPLERQTGMSELIVQALRYNIGFFKNNAHVPFAVTLPAQISRNEAEVYSDFFEKNFKGPNNAGKTIIQYGGATIQNIGLAPNDIQWLELIRTGMKLSTGLLGVPISLIGITDDANRSNSEVDRRNFLLERIQPIQKMLAAKINQFLAEHFEMGDTVFEFGEVETINLDERAKTARSLQEVGIININEARRIVGEDQIDEEFATEHLVIAGTFPTNLADITGSDLSINEPNAPEEPAPDVAV